jgi:hypothetical protein
MHPARQKFIKNSLKTGSKFLVAPALLQSLTGYVYTNPLTQNPKKFTIEHFDK